MLLFFLYRLVTLQMTTAYHVINFTSDSADGPSRTTTMQSQKTTWLNRPSVIQESLIIHRLLLPHSAIALPLVRITTSMPTHASVNPSSRHPSLKQFRFLRYCNLVLSNRHKQRPLDMPVSSPLNPPLCLPLDPLLDITLDSLDTLTLTPTPTLARMPHSALPLNPSRPTVKRTQTHL